MDLTEINHLINIRLYISSTIGNNFLDRNTLNELSSMQILIDKKIVELLRTSDFKEYINFKDARAALEEVVRLNNIKSGLKK
jgi:hypothetical protein